MERQKFILFIFFSFENSGQNNNGIFLSMFIVSGEQFSGVYCFSFFADSFPYSKLGGRVETPRSWPRLPQGGKTLKMLLLNSIITIGKCC